MCSIYPLYFSLVVDMCFVLHFFFLSQNVKQCPQKCFLLELRDTCSGVLSHFSQGQPPLPLTLHRVTGWKESVHLVLAEPSNSQLSNSQHRELRWRKTGFYPECCHPGEREGNAQKPELPNDVQLSDHLGQGCQTHCHRGHSSLAVAFKGTNVI